jgi:CRP-like cAMP-binding protein
MDEKLKGLLSRFKVQDKQESDDGAPDSVLFTRAFEGHGIDPSSLIPWEARAVEIGASRLKSSTGIAQLQALWEKGKFMSHLDRDALKPLGKYLSFATVPADRDIIRQDEYGNFMVILLRGSIAVDRVQPWGARLHLAETSEGEILGEMSLLDSGIRFSVCMTTSECDVAVLSAEAMDDMLTKEPRLAATFIALLARKLSLRLRVVSARLSEKT